MRYRFVEDVEDELDIALAASSHPLKFEIAIASAIAKLLQNPQTGSRIGRSKFRRLIMGRYPYSIVYLPEPTEIVIYAFAHHKRKPGYWKYRLRKP